MIKYVLIVTITLFGSNAKAAADAAAEQQNQPQPVQLILPQFPVQGAQVHPRARPIQRRCPLRTPPRVRSH